MKDCTKCQQSKPFDEFHKRADSKSGYTSHCKICRAKAAKSYRRRPESRQRANERRKSDKWRKYHRDYQKQYRQKAGEHTKKLARAAVERAIGRGDLTRADNCTKCGKGGKIEGHHESYERDQWLKVIWLCPVCHRKEHAEDINRNSHRPSIRELAQCQPPE